MDTDQAAGVCRSIMNLLSTPIRAAEWYTVLEAYDLLKALGQVYPADEARMATIRKRWREDESQREQVFARIRELHDAEGAEGAEDDDQQEQDWPEPESTDPQGDLECRLEGHLLAPVVVFGGSPYYDGTWQGREWRVTVHEHEDHVSCCVLVDGSPVADITVPDVALAEQSCTALLRSYLGV